MPKVANIGHHPSAWIWPNANINQFVVSVDPNCTSRPKFSKIRQLRLSYWWLNKFSRPVFLTWGKFWNCTDFIFKNMANHRRCYILHFSYVQARIARILHWGHIYFWNMWGPRNTSGGESSVTILNKAGHIRPNKTSFFCKKSTESTIGGMPHPVHGLPSLATLLVTWLRFETRASQSRLRSSICSYISYFMISCKSVKLGKGYRRNTWVSCSCETEDLITDVLLTRHQSAVWEIRVCRWLNSLPA